MLLRAPYSLYKTSTGPTLDRVTGMVKQPQCFLWYPPANLEQELADGGLVQDL